MPSGLVLLSVAGLFFRVCLCLLMRPFLWQRTSLAPERVAGGGGLYGSGSGWAPVSIIRRLMGLIYL